MIEMLLAVAAAFGLVGSSTAPQTPTSGNPTTVQTNDTSGGIEGDGTHYP